MHLGASRASESFSSIHRSSGDGTRALAATAAAEAVAAGSTATVAAAAVAKEATVEFCCRKGMGINNEGGGYQT